MRVLLMVVVAACCGCASTGLTPRPFPVPGGSPAKTPPASPSSGGVKPSATLPIRTSGYEISGTALSLRGKPYQSGGADPKGFDCSGLVRYVFGQHGIALPRTVAEQYRAGTDVVGTELAAGDLVFFSTTSSGVSHVGIVVGGDSFVHAPTSSGVVRVDRLGGAYWASRYIGARRAF